MATATVEKELLDLERQYWQAIKEKDVDGALRLTEFPCVVAGARGVRQVDRQMFTSMMKDAPWTLREFSLEDAQVRLLSKDVAVVAYKVHEDMIVEGKPLALDASDTSTWVRRDGRWTCAVHTEAIAGDSFGRDRQPARQSTK
jgi:Domain of unknown function (DUF4440)